MVLRLESAENLDNAAKIFQKSDHDDADAQKQGTNIISYLISEGKKAFDEGIPFEQIKELPARCKKFIFDFIWIDI